MMPSAGEPDIVRAMREFQLGLLNKEEGQFRLMAKAWLDVERRLEGQMSALALEIDAARASGKIITLEQVRKMDRYQRLLAESRREVGKYEKFAEGVISARQKELVAAGWAQAVDAVRLARPSDWKEFIGKTPLKAVENMVGLTADGSPLARLLAAASGESIDGVNRALMMAMAQGWNPAKTARAMADGLAGGLDRALLIARTEQMRVLRESTRMGYQASGIVTRYKRLASKSARTCLACLMADGDVYDVTTDFDEHPAGRCTLVPVVTGVPEPKWETGKEWFEKQSEATQREMMGKGIFDLYQGGLPLEALVDRKHDAEWGGSIGVTPIKSLLASGE